MASTGEGRLGRRPALDGLRGIAVLLVLVCHVTQLRTTLLSSAGNVGVTVFFTLSGFLITALLLDERARSGRVDLRAFWVRRARRLLPALAVLLVVTAGVAAVLGPTIATGRELLASVGYVANWLPAGGHFMSALNHTWSLAVEEQFYVLWPLLVLVALRRGGERAVLAVAVGGAAVSVALRLLFWDGGAGWARVYYGSDTRADALLVGCAAAVLIRRAGGGANRPTAATILTAVVAALGFTADPAARYLLLPLVVALATAGIIAATVRSTYDGWLASPVLRWVGARSYGLYLWQVLPVVLVEQTNLPWLVEAALAVGFTFVAAAVSWRFAEQPILRCTSEEPFDRQIGLVASADDALRIP